ncbi:MAG TPA: hypothetical protein VFZ09_43290 [Archangium sp.]|uniref:hypothetical protein n=1 Tax=Archangium sp. TaxID=1872627 RepID=UPI002E35006D|nr:hypothetical protein [Archangium sp.]HEX5753105.1 hypothetical protein [Archangium sp.]
MSVLETPRILFSGEIDWDPIVTNNYDDFYNELDSETIFPTVAERVKAFRQEAIAAVRPPKINWNPHGTHRSNFYNTEISGADLGGGVVNTDAFVGSPANFRGMLVDLEPYGAFTSQLFFDALSFGIEGGCRIVAPRSSRFSARYINFSRYLGKDKFRAGVASVVWQSSFAKETLTIDAFNSDVLQKLREALKADDVAGLTVQWNTYRTIYFNDPSYTQDNLKPPEQLIADLNGGGFQPNPARSRVVGVIGLWRRNEPANEPGDRTLLVSGNNSVSTAHARVTGSSLTLDLSNSISETGTDLQKQDLGALNVVAVPSSGNPVTLGTLTYPQYDKQAYLATSGIVTIPLTADGAKLATEGALQLRDSQGNVLLEETDLRAVPLVQNLYLDEGQTGMAVFQVYNRGVPAGEGISVTIAVMSADGSTILTSFALTTAADGTVSFPVPGLQGSITAYVAIPGPNPQLPADGINPPVNTYMYVRVLAADSTLAALPPTWDNVYRHVLSNWKAMAPCMDNWLDLESEQQVRAYGSLIRKLTSPSAFENFRYMPVTRDLTAGARTLLYNFLGEVPEQSRAAALAPDTAKAPEGVNFAKLSRNHRS